MEPPNLCSPAKPLVGRRARSKSGAGTTHSPPVRLGRPARSAYPHSQRGPRYDETGSPSAAPMLWRAGCGGGTPRQVVAVSLLAKHGIHEVAMTATQPEGTTASHDRLSGAGQEPGPLLTTHAAIVFMMATFTGAAVGALTAPVWDSRDGRFAPARPCFARSRGPSGNCSRRMTQSGTARTTRQESSAGPKAPRDLEQRPHRRTAQSSAQITQGLRRRGGHRHCGQPGRQLVPDQPVSDFREQTHREQEVDPDPRRKITQSSLHRASLRQDRVDQLERHDGRQLAQMPGREPARSHCDRTGDGHHRGRQDMMKRQRSSSSTSCLGRLPVPTSSVVLRSEILQLACVTCENVNYPALGQRPPAAAPGS